MWGSTPIRVSAQAYLQQFYESLGFNRVGDDYMEDGIPHLPMRRESPMAASAAKPAQAHGRAGPLLSP